ncbi:MAG TPA: YHS domain-containing protein [Blastocatellia bacterium]|nr:YHS domain-containing protein [Blastocatellia bacterium]
MRRISAVLLAIMIVSAVASASDGEKKNVTNKRCPVMNSPASEKFRTEYNGQYVYFCCQGCVKMFEKDPESYVAKLSKEDQEAIKPNEVCPVTDDKITDRTRWIEYEGRKIYFCCDGCSDMFKQKIAEKKASN